MARILRLRSSAHSRVFRELVRILRADPALATNVETWFDWGGNAARDTRPLAVALCPAVSLVPGALADQLEGPRGLAGVLAVSVGVAVAGTNADHLFDLYQAIRDAVYPGDPEREAAIRRRLEAAGAIEDPEFTQGNFGVGITDDGPMLVGTGQIRIQVRSLA
jgi:hypothetical protein